MKAMNWSYSRAYRTLKELAAMELLVPDRERNGVKRVYAITQLSGVGIGIQEAATPKEIAGGEDKASRRAVNVAQAEGAAEVAGVGVEAAAECK